MRKKSAKNNWCVKFQKILFKKKIYVFISLIFNMKLAQIDLAVDLKRKMIHQERKKEREQEKRVLT